MSRIFSVPISNTHIINTSHYSWWFIIIVRFTTFKLLCRRIVGIYLVSPGDVSCAFYAEIN